MPLDKSEMDQLRGRTACRNKNMETAWAITGVHGFYYGTWGTRAEAIGAHLEAKTHVVGPVEWGRLTPDAKREWRRLQRRGDKAVKVELRIID